MVENLGPRKRHQDTNNALWSFSTASNAPTTKTAYCAVFCLIRAKNSIKLARKNIYNLL